jgi:hypothetical protein
MGKQRNMSAEERTRLYAQNNVIVIPATETRLIRDICNCADEAQRATERHLTRQPGASLHDCIARNRALSDALNRVDFQYFLSVPGEYPGDPAE